MFFENNSLRRQIFTNPIPILNSPFEGLSKNIYKFGFIFKMKKVMAKSLNFQKFLKGGTHGKNNGKFFSPKPHKPTYFSKRKNEHINNMKKINEKNKN